MATGKGHVAATQLVRQLTIYNIDSFADEFICCYRLGWGRRCAGELINHSEFYTGVCQVGVGRSDNHWPGSRIQQVQRQHCPPLSWHFSPPVR